jgi:hypothetical protein
MKNSPGAVVLSVVRKQNKVSTFERRTRLEVASTYTAVVDDLDVLPQQISESLY